jgi:uncharacterized membrane protein YcaP (DUF421 family)
VTIVALAPVSAHRVEVQMAKSVIVLVVLVAGFRLFGKREAAQLNVYDLAMLMALANAVQNAMTGGLGNLPIGLATSATVIVAAWALSKAFRRDPGLEERFVGTPTLLVQDGHVLRRHLRRQRVTLDELAAACRAHGVEGPSQCRLAVLEVDGSISIIRK